jgi:transcription termination factor NusB
MRRAAEHGAKEDAYRFVNGILDPVSKELRGESQS